MYLNNMNQEKSMKDIKRMAIEMDMVNFIIVVEAFMKVTGRRTKWMDMVNFSMNNLLLHMKVIGKKIAFMVKGNCTINQ